MQNAECGMNGIYNSRIFCVVWTYMAGIDPYIYGPHLQKLPGNLLFFQIFFIFFKICILRKKQIYYVQR